MPKNELKTSNVLEKIKIFERNKTIKNTPAWPINKDNKRLNISFQKRHEIKADKSKVLNSTILSSISERSHPTFSGSKTFQKLSDLTPTTKENKVRKLQNFNDFINHISIGFFFYLMNKNLFDLTIKHLFYTISLRYFNLEYILVAVFGIFHFVFLFMILLAQILNRVIIKNIYTIFYLFCQLIMFILIGLIQFIGDMSYWDHKYFLNDFFTHELVKFCIETFILILILAFKISIFQNNSQ